MAVRFTVQKPILWMGSAVGIALILFLPFAIHIYSFQTRLRRNQEKWERLATMGYEIQVASNSRTDCTGGWNTIVVQKGEIVHASNSEHDDCSTKAFKPLTVEALFVRIWDECVRDRPFYRPFPICNVVYDERLGYPKRLDTYTFTEQGEYQPSITVESVLLIH